MPFGPGETANPKSEKIWRAAILRALDRASKGKVDFLKIDECAEALLKQVSKGDMTAIKELGDRLDGKAKQQIVGGDDGDTPLFPDKIEIVLIKSNAATDS